MNKTPIFPLKVKKGNSVVTIYRNTNRGAVEYRVVYYELGKRKRESLSTFEAARIRADEINESVNKGEAETIALSSAERIVYAQSLEILKPLGVSLISAVTTFADAQKIVGADGSLLDAANLWAKRNRVNAERKSLAEMVSEFIRSKADRGVSKKYRYTLELYLGKFVAACQCDIASITQFEIRAFIESQKNMGAFSKNCLRSYLVDFFKFCKKRSYIGKDWDELDHIEIAKLPPRDHISIYSPVEMAELLKVCGHLLRPHIAICGFAGLRTAEALRLDWEQVGKTPGSYIELKAGITKMQHRRLVPIQDNLLAWLAPYRKPRGRVFPYADTSFTRKLVQMCRATGFKWKHNALRHSYISYRMAELYDAGKVADEAGNSPAIILEHYREAVSKEEAARWRSIMPPQDGNIVYLNAQPEIAPDEWSPTTRHETLIPGPPEGETLTRRAAAERLGVTLEKIKRWMLEDGILPYYKLENGKVAIPLAYVNRLISERSAGSATLTVPGGRDTGTITHQSGSGAAPSSLCAND